MSAEQRAAFLTMPPAERITLLRSVGLFPVCGHHRVIASRQLAEELHDPSWLLWHCKIVAPPAGQEWADRLVILGLYDNRPFGARLTFLDCMLAARRGYLQRFCQPDEPGKLRAPEAQTRTELGDYVRVVCDARSRPTQSYTIGLLHRSNLVWNAVVQLMRGQVRNPKEGKWKPLRSAATFYSFVSLPDDMVYDLLTRVINREITMAEANRLGLAMAAEARCKKYIINLVRQKKEEETKGLSHWQHFLDEWPSLDSVAARYVGHFQTKSKPKGVHSLDAEVASSLELADMLKAGTLLQQPRPSLSFLKTAPGDSRVKISQYGNQVFVLLHCRTEMAHELLLPRNYGTLFFFVWLLDS